MALGLTTLAKERNKVLMMTSTATDDLTGKYCGPNHIHWTHDTYGLGVSVARAWLQQGGGHLVLHPGRLRHGEVAGIEHVASHRAEWR